jgi:hypothetical protein
MQDGGRARIKRLEQRTPRLRRETGKQKVCDWDV